jgi:hypothetical protein
MVIRDGADWVCAGRWFGEGCCDWEAVGKVRVIKHVNEWADGSEEVFGGGCFRLFLLRDWCQTSTCLDTSYAMLDIVLYTMLDTKPDTNILEISLHVRHFHLDKVVLGHSGPAVERANRLALGQALSVAWHPLLIALHVACLILGRFTLGLQTVAQVITVHVTQVGQLGLALLIALNPLLPCVCLLAL